MSCNCGVDCSAGTDFGLGIDDVDFEVRRFERMLLIRGDIRGGIRATSNIVDGLVGQGDFRGCLDRHI